MLAPSLPLPCIHPTLAERTLDPPPQPPPGAWHSAGGTGGRRRRGALDDTGRETRAAAHTLEQDSEQDSLSAPVPALVTTSS